MKSVDLGSGVKAIFTRWGPHDPVGVIVVHRLDDGLECSGSVLFDLPGVREHFDRPVWRLVSTQPLEIEPSVLCPTCGHHGWIRGGRWVPG